MRRTLRIVLDGCPGSGCGDLSEGKPGYTDGAVVSTDFRGDVRMSVSGVKADIQLAPTFVKICAWYDNEWD